MLKDLILDIIRHNQKLYHYHRWKKPLRQSNWFRYKTIWRIRKLTTDQGEGYTIECLLDYDYIKNYYRLIAVDLSR